MKGFTPEFYFYSFYQRPVRATSCGGESGITPVFFFSEKDATTVNTTEHPVRQLLWCALNALHAAQENHGINSESGLRRYLLEWLSGAGRHPEFRNIPEEIMALKALAEQDRDIPITGTLNTLFLSSATVGSARCSASGPQWAGYRRPDGAQPSAPGRSGSSANPLNWPVPADVICCS